MRKLKVLNKSTLRIYKQLKVISFQFSKDVKNYFKNGYFIGLLMFMAIFLSLRYFENFGSYKITQFSAIILHLGVEANIIYIFLHFIVTSFGFIFFIIPALIFSEDYELKTFLVLKASKFSLIGYFIGKELSSIFFIFTMMLIIGFSSIFISLYYGYPVTTGMIIDPYIVGAFFTLISIPFLSLVIIISTISSNRAISIFVTIFMFILFSIVFTFKVHSGFVLKTGDMYGLGSFFGLIGIITTQNIVFQSLNLTYLYTYLPNFIYENMKIVYPEFIFYSITLSISAYLVLVIKKDYISILMKFRKIFSGGKIND